MAAPDHRMAPPPATILVIDIGGSQVKLLATGETSPRKCRSGKRLTPTLLVATVHELAKGWTYEAISLGYPGLVGVHGLHTEPGHLGRDGMGSTSRRPSTGLCGSSTMRRCKRWATMTAGG